MTKKLIETPLFCFLILISFSENFKCSIEEIETSIYPTLFLIIIWYKCLYQHLEITSDDEESFRGLMFSCCKIFKEKFKINKYHEMVIFPHSTMKSLKVLYQ